MFNNENEARRDRAVGAMVGLAVGDALGAFGEFKPARSYRLDGYRAGGAHRLKAGQYTDDASMALCLAESLLEKRRLDEKHVLGLWLNWYRHGYNSSTGRCFDIGGTTREALLRFERHGTTVGPSDPFTAGNGAIMRLAPAAIAYAKNSMGKASAQRCAMRQGALTHNCEEVAVDCSDLAGLLWDLCWDEEDLSALLIGNLLSARRPMDVARADQSASGRSKTTLDTALTLVLDSSGFEDAVFQAARMGGDSDTLAAVTGQIAGAICGYSGIRLRLRAGLQDCERFRDLAEALYDMELVA